MTYAGDKSHIEQPNERLPIAHVFILSCYRRISLEKSNLEDVCLFIQKKINCISGMNCEIMSNRISLIEYYCGDFPLASSEFDSELYGLYLKNLMEVIYDENAHWR